MNQGTLGPKLLEQKRQEMTVLARLSKYYALLIFAELLVFDEVDQVGFLDVLRNKDEILV